jgi:hypothetical protein
MNIDLSKLDAKIRKLEQWKAALAEMWEDNEGREILQELVSSNGHRAHAPRALVTPVSVNRVRAKLTKKAKLDLAILEACEQLGKPFGLREMFSTLVGRGFKFSRHDPITELGAGLRRLYRAGKLKIARERRGTIGRLYERVLQ